MKRRGGFGLIAVAIIAATVGIAFLAAGWLSGAELKTVDTRFSVRGEQQVSDDVVIVGFDDRTIAEAGRFPLDRRSHARVIRNLSKAGAKVIAFDVQFTEASDRPESDESLIEAVHDTPGVVLSTTEVSEGGETQIFGGADALEYSGAIEAASLYPRDADAHVRRLDLSVHGLDTLPIAAARLKLGKQANFAEQGSEWIDYPGPAGTIPRLRFDDVEQDRFDAADVRGKVVVVGSVAERLKDFHATSADDHMPGVEVQAAAVATTLAGFPLQHAAWWLDALAILALAFLTPLVARRWGTAAGLVAGVLGVGVFLALAQVAFNAGMILTVVPVFVTAGLALVLTPAVSIPARSPLAGVMERLGPPGANPRTRRLIASSLIGSSLFIVAVTLVLQGTKALERLELSTVNYRFEVRGSQGIPDDIVLVAIDELTFTSDPKPTWPFNRRDHAAVIDNLLKAGAKVIAYDVQFTEPSGDDEADLKLFDAVMAANGKIVLAATEVRADGTTDIFGGGQDLKDSKAVPAFSSFPQDDDAKVRRMERDKNGLITFDLAAAQLASGRRISPPTARDNWIDFPGPPGTRREVSFVDVKNNTFDPALVRGKIVVVGATANNLQDFHPTSASRSTLMAGPEVHMAGIQTALEGFPLRSGPEWLNVLAVVLLGLLAPVAGLRLKVVPALLIGATGLALLLVGSQVLFEREGLINDVAYPFIAGVAAMLVTGIVHGLTTALEREQARDAFARFVPEAVVDQVLADAEGVRLGGVRGEATVMFSDLRGFTSFSETLEPERVIESLNRYLTEMSEAILDHGGTLVAYMGDGIMAVFGAPLKQSDHADRALEAARDMLGRMDGFNGWLREQGLHDGFKMGIGLNSGPVMSGNVGSERRLEYTALGDTTNTAARLEGMTKGTPHQLYISDTTRQALTRPVDDLVEVGEAEVRGRKAKVKLWSLRDGDAPAPLTEPSHRVEA